MLPVWEKGPKTRGKNNATFYKTVYIENVKLKSMLLRVACKEGQIAKVDSCIEVSQEELL